MNTQIIIMHFEKSTKNTHKFAVPKVDTKPPFGELYIQKSFMPQPAQFIKVTVEVETSGPVNAGTVTRA